MPGSPTARLKLPAWPFRGLSSAAANCGSGFFRTSLSPRSPRKPAWAKARALRKSGFRWLSREESCLKWREWTKPRRGKRCASPPTSFRFPPNLLLAQENSSMPRRIEKIREAGVNELEAQHKELSETIFRLRFQLSTGQAEALKRLREAKKDLARVNTLLRARELQTAAKAQVAAPAAAAVKAQKSSAAPRS